MRFLAILRNIEITEMFTDFFWISLVLKGSVGKFFKIIRRELKKCCEYKPSIVRLPQSVCKCQIQIPKGGKL